MSRWPMVGFALLVACGGSGGGTVDPGGDPDVQDATAIDASPDPGPAADADAEGDDPGASAESRHPVGWHRVPLFCGCTPPDPGL